MLLPLMMEITAPINAAIGVRTKVVTLRLNEVRTTAGTTIGIQILQSICHSRNGNTTLCRQYNNTTQTALIRIDFIHKELIKNKIL